MSFPDLASVTRQAQPPPDPRQDPIYQPPQPQSLPQPSRENPVQPEMPPQGQEPVNRNDLTGLRDQASPDQAADTYDYGQPGEWRTDQEPPAAYIPTSPRGFGEWGRPWWPIEAGMSLANIEGSPYMPSPAEAYGVARGAAGQLSMYASPGVGQPAGRAAMYAMQFAPILDALSKGAFSRNFNAARLGTMKIQQQQMLMDMEIAQQRHQEELMQYSRIFELQRIGAISNDDAEHRVRELAQQTGHQYLLTVLNNKGMGGAEEYLTWEDTKMRDMWAAGTTMRKATGGEQDADIASDWGHSTGSAVIAGTTTLPTKQGFSPQAPQTKLAGEVPTADPADFTSDLRKQQGLTDEELAAAQSLASGEGGGDKYGDLKKAKSPVAGQIRGRIDKAADAIRNRIGQTIRDPNMSQEQKLNALEHISPSDGDRLRGLLDYSLDPEKLPAAHQERERLLTMARALSGGKWKEGSYRIVQKYHDPNTSEGLRVQRVSSLDSAFWSLNNVLERFSETDRVPKRVMDKWISGHFSGDPKWDELYSAIRNVAVDTIAIQTGSGRPAVTLVNSLVTHMLNTNLPASIRAQAMIDARGAYGQIKTLRDQFRDEVGDPNAKLPFFGRDTNENFNAWLRSNPYTGQVPSDAPASVLAVGKAPRTLPPGAQRTTAQHPGQELPPMTKAEIRQTWDDVDALSKRGDPESLRKAQWLRERMGIFADRGSLD